MFIQIVGFPHSAFSFGIESNSIHSSIDGVSVPSGALVSVLQKGVQFVEAEACFGEVIFTQSEIDCSPNAQNFVPITNVDVISFLASFIGRLISYDDCTVLT